MRRRSKLGLLLFFSFFLLAAAERPARADVPEEKESYWYGWQTLAADGASAAVLTLGAAAPPLAVVGVGGLVLGAPIVHLANERPGAAAASLGLRVTLPALGAYFGYAAAGSCHDDGKSEGLLGKCFLHGVGEAALGALIGASAAIAVDAAVLARGTRTVARKDESALPHLTSISPSYDPHTRTTSVGLGGTF